MAAEGKYVQLTQVHPAFATAVPVEVPVSLGPCAISPELWGILESSPTLTVRQHVKLLPKHCFKCPPCVIQENSYSVYAGLTRESQYEVMRIDEVSDDWNRCCCKPYHPLKLEARQYLPIPGDNVQSDFSHLSEDVRNSWETLSGRDRENTMRNVYKNYPPLFTMLRDDGQRCCCNMPCKWLSTFVCCGFCQDGMSAYAGALQDEPEKEVGRPFNPDPSRLIASVKQPCGGGGCHPVLNLGEGRSDALKSPFALMEGPYCFGGWSEFCFDFKFPVSYKTSPNKSGDVALVVKQKPSSLGMAATYFLSDADVYSIQFNENTKLSAQQKISVLTSLFLVDYRIFDSDRVKGSQDCNCRYFDLPLVLFL
jgi:hypothetical protein